jgi:hypothetical protein
MYLFTCPQTVLRASSCSMLLPVSSSLDRMLATGSRGASPVDVTAGQQSVPWSQRVIKETRETMRKFLFIFAFFFVVLPIRATDLYIAQTATGGSTGADCGDALPYTFFTNSANWPSPIGPGTTVHICGTITAPAGASGFLAFQGSGVSGNVITLKFENGAVLTAPYWGVNGAIYANGQQYLLIDGGASGMIQATANGTHLANQQSNGNGVYFYLVSNSEVKNLNISNMYVHSSPDENGGNTSAIFVTGGTNVTVDNNIIHDVRFGIFQNFPGGTVITNYVVYGNTIYNIDHGITDWDGNTGAVLDGLVIHDNTIHDFLNWDEPADGFHHDGIHISTSHTGSAINGAALYNNYLYGDPGVDITAYIYMSGDSVGITGTYVFNNVIVDTSTVNGVSNGYINNNGERNFLFNNTVQGFQQSNNGGVSIQEGVGGAGGGDYIYNNILSTGSIGIYFHQTGVAAAMDYNVFYNVTPGRTDNAGHTFDTLPLWQSCNTTALGCPAVHDRNSVTANPSLNPGTNPPYQLASSSSAAWQKGMNLSAYCATVPAACFDKLGNPRPATGPWDIGAYESSQSSTGDKPQPPTNVAVSVLN